MSDFRTIGYDGQYTQQKPHRAKSSYWWNGDSAYEGVFGDIRTIMTAQAARIDELLTYLQLYSNHRVDGFYGTTYAKKDEFAKRYERLSLNVCRSVVNAVVAKISTNRTRPLFLTEGGNFREQKMGKDLARFIDGQFYACGVYKKNRLAFKDGCIFGMGTLKPFIDWCDEERPKICLDRVLPNEIWVDEVDGRYGEPSQLYHVKEVGREILQAEYSEKSSEIEGAGLLDEMEYVLDTIADPVSQIEAWHLESVPGHGDGRHVIAVESCDLVNEDWTRNKFPLAIFRWLDAVLGFTADGLIYELAGIQVEINKILRKISQHMHLASSFIMANKGTKFVKEHLVNTPWSLLQFTGDAPTFATIQSISPEYFLQLDRLYAKAFEVAGITQLFAQGLKPKGLDSGKALREYKDSESERFMDISQAWEEYHLELADHMIDLATEIEEKMPGYSVMAKNEDGTLTTIKFKDVNLNRDKYLMQPKPASAFSKDPAAKWQQVKELLEVIPDLQPYALKLLGYPDLESIERRLTAPQNTIERITDDIIYENKYEAPDAFIDLEQAISIARGKYHWAKNSGVPPENLETLIEFMNTCKAKIDQLRQEEMTKQAQAMAAAQAPPPGELTPGGAMGPQVGDVNIRPEINVEQPVPIPGM